MKFNGSLLRPLRITPFIALLKGAKHDPDRSLLEGLGLWLGLCVLFT